MGSAAEIFQQGDVNMLSSCLAQANAAWGMAPFVCNEYTMCQPPYVRLVCKFCNRE